MRYDVIEQGKQTGQIISFMYKHIKDGEHKGYWRDSNIVPVTWKHGKKGLHILAWDIDEDAWRRFALVNMNELQVREQWNPTDKYKKALGL